MNKRRLLWFVALLGVALLGVSTLLSLGVNWRLYGWWRGEPFCDGLPASYYAARIRAAWVIRTDLGGSVRPRQRTPVEGWLQRTPVEGWLRRYRAEAIADVLYPDFVDSNNSRKPFGPDTPDAAKLPVLLVLLGDSDMRVSWWASQKLAQMKGEAASTAAAALEKLLRDEEPSKRFIGVTALIELGPPARSALPTLFALRGDTTKVAWMSNRFDDLVDQAIRSIDPDALP